jgi:histidinol-phosphate aminotransferase
MPNPGLLEGAASLAELDLHRYPDPTAQALRAKLAEVHGISPDEVVVGNGSDELIQLLILAYAAFDGSIAVADPGYSLYSSCATRLRADVRKVPLTDEWRHDLAAMSAEDVDIVFVCNPHNPTGTSVDGEQLAAFVRNSAARMVAIDEAYIDFAATGTFDAIREAVQRPRVAVLRTLSKAHALAGLRVGYLMAHRSIIDALTRLRLPFSVNTAAQDAAVDALAHRERTAEEVARIVARRTEVESLLRKAGLDVVSSEASFVMALSSASDRLVDHLARHGVAIRPGRDLGVPDSVRVSVPSAEGLDRLASALAGFRADEVVA